MTGNQTSTLQEISSLLESYQSDTSKGWKGGEYQIGTLGWLIEGAIHIGMPLDTFVKMSGDDPTHVRHFAFERRMGHLKVW